MKYSLIFLSVLLISCQGFKGPSTEIILRMDIKGWDKEWIDYNKDLLRSLIESGMETRFGVTGRIAFDSKGGNIRCFIPGEISKGDTDDFFQSHTRLGFWEGYPVSKCFPFINAYNAFLYQQSMGSGQLDSLREAGSAITDEDLLYDRKTPTGKSAKEAYNETEIETFKRENPLFALMQPPSNNINPNSPVVGYLAGKDFPKVDSLLKSPEAAPFLSGEVKIFRAYHPLEDTEDFYPMIAVIKSNPQGPELNNSHILSVYGSQNTGGVHVISLHLTSEGTDVFYELSRRMIDKSIVIALGDKVVSYPVVNEPIMNGMVQISGDWESEEDTRELISLINMGMLFDRLEIVSHNIQSPAP